jgi:hypothetical protein
MTKEACSACISAFVFCHSSLYKRVLAVAALFQKTKHPGRRKTAGVFDPAVALRHGGVAGRRVCASPQYTSFGVVQMKSVTFAELPEITLELFSGHG